MASDHFGASVIQSHGVNDTLEILRKQSVNLVTINRKLDRDYSDGLDVAIAIKSDAELSSVPVMLVTNYDEHQETAMTAGCVRGFGKLAINDEATRHILEPFLGAEAE